MSPELYGTDINPIADGVGVVGRTAFVAFFLFGVDGPAPLSLGIFSLEGVFLFLLVFATFGREVPFARLWSSLTLEDISLNRADRLEDILYVLEWYCGFGTLITVFCPCDKGRCSLKIEVRRAAVLWIFWCQSVVGHFSNRWMRL